MPPAPGSTAGLPARRVALDALLGVLARKRSLDEAFEAAVRPASLPERDRAFAYTLATGTLRRLGQLDAVIDSCMDRPLPAKLQAVRTILRLGAAQLLVLQTPAHAAVDTSVSLARQAGHAAHAPLVNAVLHRLAADGAARLSLHDAPRLCTPDWLWRAWTAAWGEEMARSIAAAHLREPPLDLTPSPRVDASDLAARLGATVLPTGTLRLSAAATVPSLLGYEEGLWWVQDAAAALPVRLLGDVRGRRVFDLCAAPGGKTAQLAAAGADVVAVDRSPARLRRLGANLERLGLRAELVEADAASWRPSVPADAVLLDAPCSSTGTIRRNPDVPLHKTPEDVAALSALQRRLLESAAALLCPSGTLVYSVCSLLPEEGPGIVDSLIGPGQPWAREPVQPGEIGGFPEFLTSAGDLRTLPCHLDEQGGVDGFYAARLRKR